ncbi:hypothetical protein F400_gp036 [Bacillus phage BCD7]|uniref:Uncharacterized protein n=1 Tax=Bacillus phage BCD7 TaxID=1136534 RepID=J9PTX9_9CAUD|nr:hypothetical protein F400_gp036 [Bacillus phage BCD7]AEZ50483.1 hypothetical protein BCD7_0036 [Bacillus phage BCD7]
MVKLKRKDKTENNVANKEKQKTLLDTVEDELLEEGIELFNNSNVEENFLQLPADITEIESSELGRHMNAFTQQKMWTRTLIGRMEVNMKAMSRELDGLKAGVYADLPAKMSIKEKELHFRTNDKVALILQRLDIFEEKHRLLKDYLENLVDGIFNISREVSRRSADFGDDRRETNIGNKRR